MHLLFQSVQTHQKMQPGIIFHSFLIDFPTFHELQLTSASLMLSAITQLRPKTEMNMFHMPVTAVHEASVDNVDFPTDEVIMG